MSRFNILALAIVAGFLFCTASRASIIVESRSGGLNFATYSEDGVGFPNGWSNSSAKSTAPGVTAGIGSRFNTNSSVGGSITWFQVAPVLDVAGGTYLVEVTTTSASGTLTNTSTVTTTNGTLDSIDDSDTVTAGFQTTAFSSPNNQWNKVGTLTLATGQTTPTVRFDETANSNRFYADGVRFTLVTPSPEPASLSLLAIGGLALLRRRRA